MIGRSLVPRDARLPEAAPDAPARRMTTLLDERTIVAANLPRSPLETHSSIPAHMPLDVLAGRFVVPRDMPLTRFDPAIEHPAYAPVTVLDERVTVPVALPVVELEAKAPVAVQDLPEGLEPDVMTTGEVNLMVEPVEAPPFNWNLVARTGSIAAHLLFILFLVFSARLFPYQPPTQAQLDLARDQLTFIPYLPSDARGLPPEPPAPRSPNMRIDPRVLKEVAPSMPEPLPGPKEPEHVVRDAPTVPPPDLPEAPKPQTTDKPPDFLRNPAALQAQPAPQVQQPPANNGLILPRVSSPGRSLEQSANEAMHGDGGAPAVGFEGPSGGGGMGQGGGGGGTGLNGSLQMLTPTEGVDFTSYLQRVLASVQRNWYAIMPESARLGDKGRVTLQFRIMRNGSVPDAEPELVGTSYKEPLDRAALSSIRASSPFEPLPPAFSGPYIELRFIFLYNLPLTAQ
jgi:TonB family protein